jgi:L-aspartate oxidase
MNAAKKDVDEIAAFDEPPEWTSAMRAEVQRVMWNAAGIVRDTETLKEATTKMESMLEECEEKSRGADARLASIELRNLLTVGLCTLRCAASRKESRGLHYNVDYPERVETERKPTRLDTASMWNAPSSVHPALGAR